MRKSLLTEEERKELDAFFEDGKRKPEYTDRELYSFLDKVREAHRAQDSLVCPVCGNAVRWYDTVCVSCRRDMFELRRARVLRSTKAEVTSQGLCSVCHKNPVHAKGLCRHCFLARYRAKKTDRLALLTNEAIDQFPLLFVDRIWHTPQEK